MKEIIYTEKSPKAIGPYSQGVKANGFVFTSAQLPLDPETGEVAEGGFVGQTHRVMQNIKAVLEQAGTSLDNVVKATVYITDMEQFGTVNKIYGEYFSGNYPARACVEISRLAKDALVEIEVVATC